MSDSFSDLVGRLKSAGYPDCFLEEVAESLMSKLKKKEEIKAVASIKNTKPVIMTYRMSPKKIFRILMTNILERKRGRKVWSAVEC